MALSQELLLLLFSKSSSLGTVAEDSFEQQRLHFLKDKTLKSVVVQPLMLTGMWTLRDL